MPLDVDIDYSPDWRFSEANCASWTTLEPTGKK